MKMVDIMLKTLGITRKDLDIHLIIGNDKRVIRAFSLTWVAIHTVLLISTIIIIVSLLMLIIWING